MPVSIGEDFNGQKGSMGLAMLSVNMLRLSTYGALYRATNGQSDDAQQEVSQAGKTLAEYLLLHCKPLLLTSGDDQSEHDKKDLLKVVCCGMVAVAMANGTQSAEFRQVMDAYIGVEAIGAQVYEMLLESEGSQLNAMLLCLAQAIIAHQETQGSSPNAAVQSSLMITEVRVKIQETAKSLSEGSISTVMPFGQDLLDLHSEEEEDLFFELLISEETANALKRVSRKRTLHCASALETQLLTETASKLHE